MPLFTIRPVQPDDFAQWLPLWEAYNAFYARVGPKAVPLAVTETTWRRFFDADEPMHCHVAEAEGGLCGFAHFLYHRNTAMIGLVCYLQDLFTAPSMRGKGGGRALITAVCEQARQAGAPRVYWITQESNAAARGLYDAVAENSGFIVYRKDL